MFNILSPPTIHYTQILNCFYYFSLFSSHLKIFPLYFLHNLGWKFADLATFPFVWGGQLPRPPPHTIMGASVRTVHVAIRTDSNGRFKQIAAAIRTVCWKKQTSYSVVPTVSLVVRTAIERFANDFFELFAKAFSQSG